MYPFKFDYTLPSQCLAGILRVTVKKSSILSCMQLLNNVFPFRLPGRFVSWQGQVTSGRSLYKIQASSTGWNCRKCGKDFFFQISMLNTRKFLCAGLMCSTASLSPSLTHPHHPQTWQWVSWVACGRLCAYRMGNIKFYSGNFTSQWDLISFQCLKINNIPKLTLSTYM